MLRIHKRPQAKYFYALSSQESRLVRITGILGLAALAALTVGFAFFAQQHWLVAAVCGPFFTVVILYHLITFTLMTFYPGFDTKRHRQKVSQYKKSGKTPKVAVLIPAAGEDVETVRKTIRAALKIRYPNFTVHLLDDSRGGIYQQMVEEEGAIYFRRSNAGQHKKAGNLNAARAQLKDYENALVLDADFVPRREILEELVPYTGDDVSIVQSPQHFDLTDEVYARSKFEFGAGYIQRDFYRITQVARNRFGGAICVGTNALYNLSAIRQVGGYEGVGRKEWGHSEDVHTGLKTLNATNQAGKRYRIRYVPIQLAKGTCPSTHQSFYKQQNRWATGSMQLIFSGKTLFSKYLSLPQKLCYFSNSVYYFYTIGMLFSPVQLLILLLADRSYRWSYTLLFIPMLIMKHLVIPFVLRKRSEPLATSLVMISNAYTFAQALFLIVVRRPLGWEATGARERKSYHFTIFKLSTLSFFIAVYLATLAVLLINQRIGFNPSTFIVSLFLVAFVSHVVYMHNMLLTEVQLKKLHVSRHFYAYITVAALMFFSGIGSYTYRTEYNVRASTKSFIAVEPIAEEPSIIENLPPQEKEPLEPQEPELIEISASANDSQSILASEAVRQIREYRDIDTATAGKLQDKIMHSMGYQNFIYTGSSYIFSEAEIDSLILNAHVYDQEREFWRSYAESVGL